MARWQINLDNLSLGGFAPAFYKESYPSFGNKNQAGAMTNMDLTNPGFITQGPGLATLTNGTEASAVTTLIKGILDMAVTSDLTYATGGAKLYSLSSSTVTSNATFPHTIDKAAVTAESGEDVCYFRGNLYYSYGHSGSAGDIGKYDLASTFDDDWGSTVPTGAAALQDGPHQMIAGGNDVMYFANGRYVGDYDGTTFDAQALDLPTNSVVQSIAWHGDRLWISVIRPSLTGSNKITGSIYIWDGAADSWEFEIKVMGRVSGLHVKNGTLFCFYQDQSSSGGFKLGYINGGKIVDVANFTGALPAYYQITDYKDFIIWTSSADIWAYGAGDSQLPVRLFQLADAGYSTPGGLASPFGTPMSASNQSTSYKLAQFSGYDTNSAWKSVIFDVTGSGKNSKVDFVRINFETLAANARVDWKLLDNQGRTLYSDNISFGKLGAKTTQYTPINGKVTENFRVEFDYTNGNTTNAVKIKNVRIIGSTD